MTTTTHYARPGWLTRRVVNPAMIGLARLGLGVWGSRILEVPGRTSGRPRQVPVNLLTHDGRRYLVAARGTTEWVRNVRANGGRLELLLGRRRQAHTATELADADKVEVLRAYLRRWKAEVGAFFDGVDHRSTDDEILVVARRHPVFVLTP
ncbi:MAG: nitroreductase family deazaflavin-dependent oxidoreductase [Acidimicrobiia bacterium]